MGAIQAAQQNDKMKTKHTPGPWNVGDANAIGYMGDLPPGSLYIEDGDKKVICELDSCGCRHPQMEADARLIAAAPEMLEALNVMVASFAGAMGLDEDDIDADGFDYDCVEQARAAIAKAKGGAV